MTRLPQYVSIYIPGTDRGNQPADQRKIQAAVSLVARTFSEQFGGATVSKAIGAWLSQEHGLIEETVTIVKSFYDGSNEQALDVAVQVARSIKVAFRQEAVSVEQNGTLILV